MVLYKQGATLYNGVKELVEENLEQLAKDNLVPAFPTSSTSDTVQRIQEGERFLKAIRAVWDDHTGSMSKLRDLLKYMVRVWLRSIGCIQGLTFCSARTG